MAGSPSGAPASIQACRSRRSRSLRDRSFAHSPCSGLANHGGIRRSEVMNLIISRKP